MGKEDIFKTVDIKVKSTGGQVYWNIRKILNSTPPKQMVGEILRAAVI